jgi:predicted nucleic acid-binding protein
MLLLGCVSFWDAPVIHAAHAAGAATLYSEDLSDGHHYEGIRVVNPFKESANHRS